MTSTQSLPELAPPELALPEPPPASAPVDRVIRLPAHCTTVTAEDIRVRLVLAADFDGAMEVDAGAVESVGQATLQLLVAAHAEAAATGQRFAITDASPAFVDRVTQCRLAGAIGLERQKEAYS